MTALPSFVELMSSLGLQNKPSSDSSSSPGSSPPQSPASPTTPAPTSRHARARSTSLADHTGGSRLRGARFSPYLVADVTPYSRQAISSVTSPTNTEFDQSTARAASLSPLSSPSMLRKQVDTSLSAYIYDSTTDLSANTPISSYVRRRTPPESPSSKSFTCEASPSASPMPVSLPTLPPLFSLSAACCPLPSSLSKEADVQPSHHIPYRPEALEGSPTRRSYRYGVRISALRSADLASNHRRRHVAPIA